MKKTTQKYICPAVLKSLFLLLVLWIFSRSVGAQGFSVQPMLFSITARPGTTMVQEIAVKSARADGVTKITVSPSVIGQSEEGAPVEIDPKDPEQSKNLSTSRSCADWISVSTNSLQLAPMETKKVTVRMKIPQNARGFYDAGIVMVERKAGSGNLAINMEFRFLPLFLVTVQGPPASQKIALTGASMKMVPKTDKKPASTSIALMIENQGETFARVHGTADVSLLTGDIWRRVTEVKIAERGIFPGVVLSPGVDIKRALPTGHYRINGQLFIDNRPSGRVNQEFDYRGDPSITRLAADASLGLDPVDVLIQATPGARRSGILVMRNSGMDPLQVRCEAAVSPGLSDVPERQNNGEIYSCTPWIQVTPAMFTLRGGGSQSVRINVAVPVNAPGLPNYYANLAIHSAYADGQTAGDTVAPIVVENAKAQPLPKAVGLKMNLTSQEKNTYAVVAQFANTGNTYITPTVMAYVNPVVGDPVASVTLQSPSKSILPLANPQFSGVLDFAGVKPGTYALNATMTYGNKQTVIQTLPIKVEIKAGQRIVTVLDGSKGKAKPVVAKRTAVKKS